jgi:hypothetical protein
MLKHYRLTIWYIARTDGELQFVAPMMVDAASEGEASRTAIALANFIHSEFALKVMVQMEGNNFSHLVEVGQPDVDEMSP